MAVQRIVWRCLATGAIGALGWLLHPAPASAGGHGPAAPTVNAIEVSDASASGHRAVKLGEFNIRTSNTVSSRKDGVSFVLHATVKSDHFADFERLYANRKNKVRDQIVVATRLVPIEDYDDPQLKKVRRRILLRLRRSLPELAIEDVVISDFALSSLAN